MMHDAWGGRAIRLGYIKSRSGGGQKFFARKKAVAFPNIAI
jgi:hypothetical protein